MKIKPALQRGLLRFGSLRSPTLRKPRCKVLHIFPLFQHFKDRFFFLFPDVIWRKYRSSTPLTELWEGESSFFPELRFACKGLSTLYAFRRMLS